MLDLFDEWVVRNPKFPPRADVSFLLRQTIARGGKVLLEGPQSYFLSNAAEKIWDSGTLPLPLPLPLPLLVHLTPTPTPTPTPNPDP